MKIKKVKIKKMNFKKIAAIIIALMVIAPPVFAADTTTPPSGSTLPAVEVKAKSAILVEAATGTVLYENNAHEKLYPASITKIMTELLVLEALEAGRIKWEDKVTCSAHCASMGGSDIWLAPGEVMSVTDLFKAMAVNSANDAAVALAETVAGSETAFANLMNEKAKNLGMNDSHFVNCTGLDNENNYTSIWMDSLRGGKTGLVNTNKLIHSYTGANGLKTGSTSKAGFCLSATALRNSMQLITVVMDCNTLDDRFSSAASLLDYGFANWSCVAPKIKTGSVRIKVLHGECDDVQAVADASPSILVGKGKENGITQKVSFVPNVLAPVVKGQVVGQITFWADGKNVGTVMLKANQAVGKMTFFKAYGRLFGGVVGS
jgi:D-alanyl-D-alanine carboxypeptidase (penicillin-binding protein 5/6)